MSNILSVLHFAEKCTYVGTMYVRVQVATNKNIDTYIYTNSDHMWPSHHRNQVVISKARLIVLKKKFIILRYTVVVRCVRICIFIDLNRMGKILASGRLKCGAVYFLHLCFNNIIQFQGKKIYLIWNWLHGYYICIYMRA